MPVNLVKTDLLRGAFAMAVPRRAIRIWILCSSCDSAVPLESLWIDDQLLCRECAFRLMLERIKQSDLADQQCQDELGYRILT